MIKGIENLKKRAEGHVLGAVEKTIVQTGAGYIEMPAVSEEMSWKQRAKARITTVLGYGMIGTAAMGPMVGTAFADELKLTSLENVLDFIGNIIVVVGVALAGWNVVQAGQQMKESGGLQFNQNVWGIIGGIAMAIGGGALKSAASLWNYGSVPTKGSN